MHREYSNLIHAERLRDAQQRRLAAELPRELRPRWRLIGPVGRRASALLSRSATAVQVLDTSKETP